MLFLKNWWNAFDILVICLNIVFVILDIKYDEGAIKSVLKVRGIFRVLRIVIVIRKLNTVRIKRDR